MSNKLRTYFGFCIKSGNLVSGYDTCLNLIKRKKIQLIIITEDASGKTRSRFEGLCETAGIPLYIVESSEYMADLTGIEDRNIFGVMDKNLANAIAKEINSMNK